MVWMVFAWLAVIAVVVGIACAAIIIYSDAQEARRKAGKEPSTVAAVGVVAGNVLAWVVMLGILFVILRVEPGVITSFLGGSGRYGD